MHSYTLYYQIVPIGDGYHYVGLNENNQPTLYHKKYRTPQTTNLLFKTEEAAQEYININLEVSRFKPQSALFLDSYFNLNS